MKLGIVRLYAGQSGKIGYYNIQELGLAKALEKKDIEVDIFFLYLDKDIRIEKITEKIRIVYLPAHKIANHGIISPKFLLEYNVDIVHLLSDNQIMVPSFIKYCRKNKIPMYCYIGTVNSDTKNKYKRFIMEFISNMNFRYYHNTKVVVKSAMIKGELLRRNVRDVKLIPVGLDRSIIPNICEGKESLRNTLCLPVDKNIVTFVGRLEEYKNPIKVIELIRLSKKLNKDYFFIVIGEGTLKNKILQLIDKYDLNEYVKYIEKVENDKIHKYYKTSDWFINLNDKEIFGMSILEAMYQGCKVIAIDAPGPSYIIDNEINGILMKDFNFEEWLKYMDDYLVKSELSLNAKRKIEECFNWDVIANQYIKIFDELRGEYDV